MVLPAGICRSVQRQRESGSCSPGALALHSIQLDWVGAAGRTGNHTWLVWSHLYNVGFQLRAPACLGLVEHSLMPRAVPPEHIPFACGVVWGFAYPRGGRRSSAGFCLRYHQQGCPVAPSHPFRASASARGKEEVLTKENSVREMEPR